MDPWLVGRRVINRREFVRAAGTALAGVFGCRFAYSVRTSDAGAVRERDGYGRVTFRVNGDDVFAGCPLCHRLRNSAIAEYLSGPYTIVVKQPSRT